MVANPTQLGSSWKRSMPSFEAVEVKVATISGAATSKQRRISKCSPARRHSVLGISEVCLSAAKKGLQLLQDRELVGPKRKVLSKSIAS